jgi:hypothetical protein
MASISIGSIICTRFQKKANGIVISVKPVLKLLFIAAGGAILARKGLRRLPMPLTTRALEFDCFEGHVSYCSQYLYAMPHLFQDGAVVHGG